MKSLSNHLAVAALLCACNASAAPVERVLLISVDGLHAFDLAGYTAAHPTAALTKLSAQGITYSGAHTPAPADSFPGTLALTSGGTPAVTGVYYDESYARELAPPGSDCALLGTAVDYNESLDMPGKIGLNPRQLPLHPAGCTPVYPHGYVRVNTVFEVIKQAGGRTAWIDKHPVYELVAGPSGQGLDDLYAPEFEANAQGRADAPADRIAALILAARRYDATKTGALLNQINGHTHDGTTPAPVPTLFGLNLVGVNVAQKVFGYRDAQGTPTPGIEAALTHTDQLIADIVAALRQRKLLASTLIIVTAKHGNGPVDPTELRHINRRALKEAVESVLPGTIAAITADQAALIWLRDAAQTEAVALLYQQNKARLGLREVWYGDALAQHFPSPRIDSRSPDLVLIPENGVIYEKPGDGKMAEHGGFSEDNTHVALLLSHPSFAARRIDTPVASTQVAPTLLASLGLSPASLQAVQREGTPILPGTDWSALHKPISKRHAVAR